MRDMCSRAPESLVVDIFKSIALNETHGNQSCLSPRWCLLQFFIATAVLFLATQIVREGEPNPDGFAPPPMSDIDIDIDIYIYHVTFT